MASSQTRQVRSWGHSFSFFCNKSIILTWDLRGVQQSHVQPCPFLCLNFSRVEGGPLWIVEYCVARDGHILAIKLMGTLLLKLVIYSSFCCSSADRYFVGRLRMQVDKMNFHLHIDPSYLYSYSNDAFIWKSCLVISEEPVKSLQMWEFLIKNFYG